MSRKEVRRTNNSPTWRKVSVWLEGFGKRTSRPDESKYIISLERIWIMNEKPKASLWDTARSAIDARIKEIMTRPTLAETLQDQNEKQITLKHSWMEEFRADKGSYIFAGISAVFTSILGLILGLAPALVTNPDGSTYINFHTDFLHWTMAILLAVVFVAVTEAAFLHGKNKF